MSKKDLVEQYEAALQLERDARARCYDANGKLLVLIKGPNGEARTNPYLIEWHRAIETVRSLARELGVTEAVSVNEQAPLVEATRDGDQLGALNALALVLAEKIETSAGRGLPSLSREYRETVMTIKELQAERPKNDRIGKLIAEGQARAHRLGLTAV